MSASARKECRPASSLGPTRQFAKRRNHRPVARTVPVASFKVEGMIRMTGAGGPRCVHECVLEGGQCRLLEGNQKLGVPTAAEGFEGEVGQDFTERQCVGAGSRASRCGRSAGTSSQ